MKDWLQDQLDSMARATAEDLQERVDEPFKRDKSEMSDEALETVKEIRHYRMKRFLQGTRTLSQRYFYSHVWSPAIRMWAESEGVDL